MRVPLLCALNCALLTGGMTTTASNLSRPLGESQLERLTLRSLGVYWIIQGDDNQNGFIGLEYRKLGSSPWRTGARLCRVERWAHLMERIGSELEVPDDGWLFAGSALLLEPATAYELRLTLADPDGGKATRTLRAWTRSEPLVSNTARVRLMRKDGWWGWKSEGPAFLANCPFYRAAYFPARTRGWDATMVEYDRKSEVYEYGYHVGHRALFSMRPGESLVREAGNRGLHVNMETDTGRDGIRARALENDLVYVNEFFPGYRGGVVANGTHRYAPNVKAGDLAIGSELYANLAAGTSRSPVLHVKQSGKSGIAVVPMVSPYVYLGGRLKLKAVGRSNLDHLTVSISTNNGRSFTELSSVPIAQPEDLTIDLKGKILRLYAYWIKIELTEQAGLDALEIENDIQHAPRTLPWLGKGSNTITVAADRDPTIATRSIACRITPDASFTKNETSSTMGLTFENVNLRYDACWWKGGTGLMTVPIDVPGDLVSLGFSAQIRARSEKDLVHIVASTNGGTSWRAVADMKGPTQGHTGHFRVADWPRGTRQVLLRFEMTGNNTVGVQSFRVDADYRDPLAAKTIHPFRVVHRWTEQGQAKTHSELITKLPTKYTIRTSGEPEMVSVAYEMAATR